jgi:hypothetical protein
MRIHIRRTKQPSRYRLKPASFLVSASLHGLVMAMLLLMPTRPPRVNRPVYETEIKPYEKKIIWYNFRQTVPNLPATRKIGSSKDPQGQTVSPQIVIATSKDATKSKQFIWLPTEQKRIEQEIKAPNIVSVKPAEATAQKQMAPPSPPQPEPIKAAETAKAEEGPAIVKQPPRRFEPTPQPRPKIVVQTPTVIAEPPPGASVLGGGAPMPDMPTGAFSAGKIPPKQYVPPNMSKAGTESAKIGTITAPAPELSSVGNVNMAIVGLHPSDSPPIVPLGSLPGRFSTAPKEGKDSTGNLPTNAAGVPNLVVEGGAKARSGAAVPAPPTIPPARTVLYRQVVTGAMPSSLSAPLRPGNRTIPGALEARFQGLNVYTMVLPGPNLPGYAGDWVLWFAERQSEAGERVQMRAPVPYKKKISGEAIARSSNPVMRVQVAGLVGKDGRLEQLTILKGGGSGNANAVLEDLKAWEFAPATRNLVPVAVDVVIEIPFRP